MGVMDDAVEDGIGESGLARAAAIRKLMQEDTEVQRLALRVKHLLEPPTVLANGAILR